MQRYGYHGKILHIDLGASKSWIEEPDDQFWRLYAGGGLLATYYLLRETAAGIDALAPENLLVLSSSVMAGHPYAGLARFTAAAKSPLTGGIGETRCEGPFGIALKGSGVDAVVIRGCAQSPTLLSIENGAVEFLDAGGLWGLTVGKTMDQIESQFGTDLHAAVIGPAGENRVRFASIVTDRGYQAARMGMGAVMGSKNVKAVVLRGDNHPPVADPQYCEELTASYSERMKDNDLTKWQLEPPGFSAWVHLHGIDAALCVNNYRESVFAGADEYDAAKFMDRFLGEGECPGCPNNCIKFFGTGDDATYDPRVGGIHQEVTGTMGPNLGITDLETVFRANVLCNDLGMDPTSLGFTLSMAMECVQEGILGPADVGQLAFSEAEATLEMVRCIAAREGFGDILAEGARRAAAKIGNGAERYALHVKGQEMVCFEPRTQTDLALGFATAPIGPRYDICEHDWDFDTKVGWDHTLYSSRTLGILERIPMEFLGEKKVRNFKVLNTIWSGADTLDMCIFGIAPTRVLTLQEMTGLLAAVTGWNTSGYEIMRLGERRLHLMRVYNLREGLAADDDTLPDRFFEDPIPEGDWAGHKLDRDGFMAAIKTYYEMMGWDEAGRPRRATLVDHQLEWAEEC